MIGRGSRIWKDKTTFDVIDLGNNAVRFGLWEHGADWQKIFRSPDYFLSNIISDEEIERRFKYVMPDEIRSCFSKTETVTFDVKKENARVVAEGLRTSVILETSIQQHTDMIVENSKDFAHALALVRLLNDDIADRVRRYCYCICKSTKNYRDWVQEDYKKKLKSSVMKRM